MEYALFRCQIRLGSQYGAVPRRVLEMESILAAWRDGAMRHIHREARPIIHMAMASV